MSVSNKHHITVSANVRDASGGNAYAITLLQDVSIADIKANIADETLPLTKMKHLGSFYPSTTTYTTVTGNVEESVDFTNIAAPPGALKNYNATTGEGIYYVYLYVVDIFNNRVIQPHPNNPIHMKADTMLIYQVDNLFVAADTSGIDYVERRHDISEPQVNQRAGEDLFDFYNDRIDALYANVELTLNESVVSNVSVVAMEQDYDLNIALNQSNISDFVATKVSETQIVDNTTHLFDQTNLFYTKALSTIYASVDDNTGASIEFGKTYHVYSVLHDVGFDKHVVRKIQDVSAGSAPGLTQLSATIVQI